MIFGEIAGESCQAMAALFLGDVAQALEHSRRSVSLLDQHGVTEVIEEEVLYHHARVLQAAHEEEDAVSYLRKAHAEVMRKANRINAPALRESFLSNVPLNREILAAWPEGDVS